MTELKVRPCLRASVSALRQLCEAAAEFPVVNKREPDTSERLGCLFREQWLPEIAKAAAHAAGRLSWGDTRRTTPAATSVWLHTPFPAHGGDRKVVEAEIRAFFKDSGLTVLRFHNSDAESSIDHITFELAW